MSLFCVIIWHWYFSPFIMYRNRAISFPNDHLHPFSVVIHRSTLMFVILFTPQILCTHVHLWIIRHPIDRPICLLKTVRDNTLYTQCFRSFYSSFSFLNGGSHDCNSHIFFTHPIKFYYNRYIFKLNNIESFFVVSRSLFPYNSNYQYFSTVF